MIIQEEFQTAGTASAKAEAPGGGLCCQGAKLRDAGAAETGILKLHGAPPGSGKNCSFSLLGEGSGRRVLSLDG